MGEKGKGQVFNSQMNGILFKLLRHVRLFYGFNDSFEPSIRVKTFKILSGLSKLLAILLDPLRAFRTLEAVLRYSQVS